MTGPQRNDADVKRRRNLLLAAAGWHPASAATAAAHRSQLLTVPRLVRYRGEEAAS